MYKSPDSTFSVRICYVYKDNLFWKDAFTVQFKRIKDLREDNDLLQKDIANLLGISQQYYSEYENGKRTITISHLITLAKYYNVSIDYLVGLTNDRDDKKANKLA